jgi:hypothetical protein
MVDPIIEIKGSLKDIKLENMLLQQIRSEISESFQFDLQNVKLNIDLIMVLKTYQDVKKLIN